MKLIKIHAAAAVLTVAMYALLTGDDPSYIADMVTLYLLTIVAMISVDEWWHDMKRKYRRRLR